MKGSGLPTAGKQSQKSNRWRLRPAEAYDGRNV